VGDGGRSEVGQSCWCATLPPVPADSSRLQARQIEPGRGGVGFCGPQELVYHANLWLRTAIRVLRPILGNAPAASPEELYQHVAAVDWSEYLTPDHTFAVDCNLRDSAMTHSHYAALKTKDAICDWFRARHGRRPSVDVKQPMLRLNLHIDRDRMTLSLDSSGESLHKRGYRPVQTRAPLNEALAAGLVLLAGWDGSVPLVDPMCGSGTIPIEASWISLDRPPGLTRRRFGFHGWLDFDLGKWTAIRDAARRQVKNALAAAIAGSDVRRDAIALARRNARAAGVGHLLEFSLRDLRDLPPHGLPAGVIFCNPPYGERLGDRRQLAGLYRIIGETLKRCCAGWTAYILSGNPELEEQIGLRPAATTPLFNGALACRLLKYEIW
jgi:putative N6-adenine-specific DNA methylase